MKSSIVRVLKPWGEYLVLEKRKNYWLKKLWVRRGERLSLQSHKDRLEIWVVLAGEIEAVKGRKKFKLKAGDFLKIAKNEKHRISGRKDSWVLEAAFGRVRESDIIRFQDDYGRLK